MLELNHFEAKGVQEPWPQNFLIVIYLVKFEVQIFFQEFFFWVKFLQKLNLHPFQNEMGIKI